MACTGESDAAALPRWIPTSPMQHFATRYGALLVIGIDKNFYERYDVCRNNASYEARVSETAKLLIGAFSNILYWVELPHASCEEYYKAIIERSLAGHEHLLKRVRFYTVSEQTSKSVIIVF